MPEARRPARGRKRPFGHPNTDPGRRLLRRAHQMMEVGKLTDAANIFENLARKAEDRGRLRHAPNLYLQAGRANLLAGNTEPGSDLIHHGLSILVKEKRWTALARSGKRVLKELQEFGFTPIADEVSKWLAAMLPEPLHFYQQSLPTINQLPLKCPDCGGVLWPNEVAMIDDVTVECPYCGSSIRDN